MKHISNEQKANEIARDMLPYNNAEYHACYNSAIKAMEWKDEQFLQWLKENLAKETFTIFTSESQGVINFEPIIKAFEELNKQ